MSYTSSSYPETIPSNNSFENVGSGKLYPIDTIEDIIENQKRLDKIRDNQYNEFLEASGLPTWHDRCLSEDRHENQRDTKHCRGSSRSARANCT